MRKIHIQKTLGSLGRYLEVVVVDHDYREAYKIILEKVEIERGCMIPVSGTLDLSDAQMIVDELWNCGIRPSEGVGSAGQLAATQDHLQDMREIVSHQGLMAIEVK